MTAVGHGENQDLADKTLRRGSPVGTGVDDKHALTIALRASAIGVLMPHQSGEQQTQDPFSGPIGRTVCHWCPVCGGG